MTDAPDDPDDPETPGDGPMTVDLSAADPDAEMAGQPAAADEADDAGADADARATALDEAKRLLANSQGGTQHARADHALDQAREVVDDLAQHLATARQRDEELAHQAQKLAYTTERVEALPDDAQVLQTLSGGVTVEVPADARATLLGDIADARADIADARDQLTDRTDRLEAALERTKQVIEYLQQFREMAASQEADPRAGQPQGQPQPPVYDGPGGTIESGQGQATIHPSQVQGDAGAGQDAATDAAILDRLREE